MMNRSRSVSAGRRACHYFINRSGAPAQYLEIGNRVEGDNAFHPDDDLARVEVDGETHAVQSDRKVYPRPAR
jgi:uncharacterized cupin superfamily protein